MIKLLGLLNKTGGCIVGALPGNQIIKHDAKSILNSSKIFYSNLARSLLAKFLKPPN